jgi:hypothetical protein
MNPGVSLADSMVSHSISGFSSSRIQLRAPSPRLIEIRCTGEVLEEDSAYLPELSRQVTLARNQVSLLFHVLDISGFAPAFPVHHLHFFRTHRAQIKAVAVVYVLRSVEMAILAVRLAASIEIEGFSNVPDALLWLDRY